MYLVRHVMQLFKTNPERLPMVWFLLGLLFNAAGLFLGFEFSVAFGYMVVGWACCVFGIVLFVLHLMEPARKSAKTRLSPGFISAGATVAMPAISNVENEQAPE
jgi:NADH:ubiquinone oxidoreductase subunit 6 (subunit J)